MSKFILAPDKGLRVKLRGKVDKRQEPGIYEVTACVAFSALSFVVLEVLRVE